MPSSFTSRLKLERQASGENSGTWGNLVNYVFNRLDASVSGYQAVNVAGAVNVTLTSNNSTSNTDDDATDDQVHNAILEFTGTLTGNIHVFTDAVEQKYVAFNNTTGDYTLTFGPASGTGVELKQGAKTIVYTDGSTMFDVLGDAGDIASLSLTATGNVTGSSLVASANTVDIQGSAPNVAATNGTNTDLLLSSKGTGFVTFNGGGKIQQLAEKVNVSATAATGTINFDVIDGAVQYFTSDAAANYTLNIRGNSSVSLNDVMDTGESMTIAHLVTQGGTAYYNNAVQVDGSSVTPEWQGGEAPSEGNSNSVDTYVYTAIKTANATFTVFASQTQFA